MRWLVHGKVTQAANEALKRHEQTTKSLEESELAESSAPEQVLKTAMKAQLEIITTDSALIDAIYESRVPFARVLVFLQLEGGDIEQDDAIDRLFKRYKRLTSGRIYTVTGTRVKIRQLPTSN